MENANGETKPAEAQILIQNGDAGNGKLPDAQTLQDVGELLIKDENGKSMAFKSPYEDQPGRRLIVLIRHFYCGVHSTPTFSNATNLH